MRSRVLTVFAPRVVIAGLVWWVLTDGALGWDALVIGVPAVVAAAAVSTALLPPIGWSWIGALRFFGFFLFESWRGGLDVARRALDPRMPLAPGVIRHETRAAPDFARVAIVNTSSLLPGSLSVDVRERDLLIHALDAASGDARRTLVSSERRIAAMLRLRARAPGDGAEVSR